MVWQSPTKPWASLTKAQQEDRRLLWSAGKLRYKLDPLQRKLYDAVRASFAEQDASAERWFYLDCSRQVGKDFTSAVIALEDVLRLRRALRIVYAAATQTSVRELLVPNLVKIFDDCPPELLPAEIHDGTFTKSADRITWPWKAQIVMVGMDLHPGRLRGPSLYAGIFSEAAFYADFSRTLKSVVIPQLQTEPDGWWLMPTTPPETPAHDVDVDWLPEAKRTGRHFHATIDDNPRISERQKKAQIRLLGGTAGRSATMVRRELLAEHVTEESLMVIPEWQSVRDKCVREFERPPWVDCYVSLDPGIVHFCASQQAFFDFASDTLFVEGDFAAPGLNTWEVAVRLWAREWQLWGTQPLRPKRIGDDQWAAALEEIRGHFYDDVPEREPLRRWTGSRFAAQPYMRVSDTDLRLIADLNTEHGLVFTPAQKDDLDAAINALRLRVQAGKIVVHPRCTHTISHLDHGIWNKKRTAFAESGSHGHFDALAALVYLDRHVQRRRNPVPPPDVFMSRATHHIPPEINQAPRSQTGKVLEQVFGGRRTAQKDGRPKLYRR